MTALYAQPALQTNINNISDLALLVVKFANKSTHI